MPSVPNSLPLSDGNANPATAPAPQRPWVRRLARLVKGAALFYLLVLVVMYFGQTWFVLPGRRSQGWKSAVVRPEPGEELVRFTTAQGDRVTALFGPALTADGRPRSDAARRPTLLYFYGTGSWLKTVVPEVEAFRRLGVNVLAPEYVGYGMNQGAASEANCYATADAAYEYLRHRPDVDPHRIVSTGSSLGGAVAIDLASRKPVAGLVTFSTFTTMEEMARRQYGFLPIKLLLHQRFASEEKMGRVRCPILMFHGISDPFIPFSMMARLAGRAAKPVKQVPVPGADHDHFFATGGYQQLPALAHFVAKI